MNLNRYESAHVMQSFTTECWQQERDMYYR